MHFREFWPAYLRAHSRSETRVAHYVATTIGLGGAAIAIGAASPGIGIAAVALAYAIAVSSHRIFEGGRSMVRVNPVWGALADLRMCWLALTGGLHRELERGGIRRRSGTELSH